MNNHLRPVPTDRPIFFQIQIPILSPIPLHYFLLYRYMIVSDIGKKWVLYHLNRKENSIVLKSERKSHGQWEQALRRAVLVWIFCQT